MLPGVKCFTSNGNIRSPCGRVLGARFINLRGFVMVLRLLATSLFILFSGIGGGAFRCGGPDRHEVPLSADRHQDQSGVTRRGARPSPESAGGLTPSGRPGSLRGRAVRWRSAPACRETATAARGCRPGRDRRVGSWAEHSRTGKRSQGRVHRNTGRAARSRPSVTGLSRPV